MATEENGASAARNLSPLSIGGATALGAGWLLGPVAGIGLGLLQGILAKRMKKSALDDAADEESTRADLNANIESALEKAEASATTDMDRAQLETLSLRRQQMHRLAKHPDPKVRAKALEELANISTGLGAWQEDIETRSETTEDKMLDTQRGTVTTLAKELRGRYETAIENRRSLQASAGQIHQFLNDPKFDVNNSLNRGRLIELLKSNARSMLADPDDLGDALTAAGGSAIIGPLAALAGGLMSADDFDFSKEDWRKIATAMYDFEGRQFKSQMERVQQGVAELEPAAQRLGILPADYSVAQFVLGQEEEFPRPYADSYSETATKPKVGPVDQSLRNLEEWATRKYPQNSKKRPTN